MKWGPQAFGQSPLPQGTRIDALVGAQDVYATLAELTATSLPLDQARDSFSMLRALMGETTTIRDHMVQEAEIDTSDSDVGGRFAYRDDSWKLIFNADRVPSELYNLANDPFETTNLVSRPEQSSRVAAMRSDFEDALASTRTAPPTGGGDPEFSLSPTSIAFGTQPLRVDSAVQAVTLSSTGGSALSISSITLTGSNPGQFSQSNNCSATQPTGSTCTISVKFRPTSTGSKRAFVTVVATDGAGTKQVELTGTGARSALSVSPTSLAFGNQARGTVSAPRVVTVTNTGTVFLPIVSITIVGSNSKQFRQTNDCPAQVAVGGTCTVSVTFNPRSTGNKFASLRITPGGGASEKSVALTGTGT
jgi:hypothetical protein